MFKITEVTAEAFKECREKKIGNSQVENTFSGMCYYLHDNLIAMYRPDKNELWISDAGRQSKTTKERLNGILREFRLGRIFQHKGKWYLSHVTDGLYERDGEKTFNLQLYNTF